MSDTDTPVGTEAVACECNRCVQEAVDASSGSPFDPRLIRMFVCSMCGNKRCPRAADHRNACTNSNEPGQPGSSYPAHPPRPIEAEMRERVARMVDPIAFGPEQDVPRKGFAEWAANKAKRAETAFAKADAILSTVMGREG